MKKEDIEVLAGLARINLTEEEKETYASEMGSILAYVDKIREVATEDKPAEIGSVFNVFREDVVKEYDNASVERIKNEFPDKEGDFLKVKSIL